ncbi:MAG: lipoate--protein ligase family protein [Desulfurococcales archaeon]|nr:lipoate--protein ligase family protein [Desulfurococcales archaeon]
MKAYILPEPLPPPLGLAFEEILLRKASPSVAVWRHRDSVIVGRSTGLDLEVDCDTARSLGVPVYRRMSGGGAVYHDPGNINISMIIPTRGRAGYREVYGVGLDLVKEILHRLDLYPQVENRTDVVVMGWKVSGSAAYITRRAALYHATLLVEADTARLHMLVKPRLDLVEKGIVTPAKYRPRNISSMRPDISVDGVISIIEEVLLERGYIVTRTPPQELLLAVALLEKYRGQCQGGAQQAPSTHPPVGVYAHHTPHRATYRI